jgi:hypothetical protein
MSFYNDKFDPEEQINLEEQIAFMIYDELNIDENIATELSKRLLITIVKELRPDLIEE